MKSVYDKELREVKRFLDARNRKAHFSDIQDVSKQYFYGLQTLTDFRTSILDVYSRADVSRHAPIKTDRKIAVKLHKWRRYLKPGEKNPRPKDIHDIAGITVVCAFPSDMEKLHDYLLLNGFGSEGRLALADLKLRDPFKNAGYHAYHGIIDGKGRLDGVRCELQIKTILTEAWGKKNHDLIYKPNGDIDTRHVDLMQSLTFQLNILDRQSETLKSQIVEAWSFDERRKQAARKEMMTLLLDSGSPTHSLLDYFNENEAELSIANLEEDIVVRFEALIDKFLEDHNSHKDYCRLLTIHALNRRGNDRNGKAMDAIDEWINDLHDEKASEPEICNAIIFKSLSMMALGEYAEAINSGKIARDIVLNSTNLDENEQDRVTCNLAYFLSEAHHHRYFDEPEGAGVRTRETSDQCGIDALGLIQYVSIDEESEDPKNVFKMDTIGAVKICCSHVESEIKEGLRLCNLALALAKKGGFSDSLEAAHELHEKRAFRLLSRL